MSTFSKQPQTTTVTVSSFTPAPCREPWGVRIMPGDVAGTVCAQGFLPLDFAESDHTSPGEILRMVMQNTITAEAKGSTDGANARAKLADIGRGLMASAGATCEARKRTFDRACGSGGLPTMVNRFLLLHTAIDACLCTRRADAPLGSGASPRLPGMVNSGSGISVTVSSAAAGNSESAPAPVALTATAQPPSSLRAPSAAAGLAHADDSEASTASAADVPNQR